MQIGHYIKRIQGNKKMLIAGPFKTKKQATIIASRLYHLDVTKCPQEFIRSTNFDYGRGFFTVSKIAGRNSLPKSWLGSEKERFEEKNVI